MVKNLLANAGGIRGMGSIPESGRSPGGGDDNSFQYSCLENPMDRGTWWAIIHRVAKIWTCTPKEYCFPNCLKKIYSFKINLLILLLCARHCTDI